MGTWQPLVSRGSMIPPWSDETQPSRPTMYSSVGCIYCIQKALIVKFDFTPRREYNCPPVCTSGAGFPACHLPTRCGAGFPACHLPTRCGAGFPACHLLTRWGRLSSLPLANPVWGRLSSLPFANPVWGRLSSLPLANPVWGRLSSLPFANLVGQAFQPAIPTIKPFIRKGGTTCHASGSY